MNIVIVGGGIAGLMAAIATRKANGNAKITLLEQSERMGGLLAGIEYPEHGLYFDLGTHIFQETGNTEFDAELLQAIPSADLLYYPQTHGDLSGSVYNGELQTNVHFPDIRHHTDCDFLISSVKKHINSLTELPALDRAASLLDAATARFGHAYAERVLGPMLSHVFHCPAERLSAFSMLLPGLTRTVIDDHDEWMQQSQINTYRSIAAIPDQRNLPSEIGHSRNSFYSRKKGSRAFIDGLVSRLSDENTHLLTGAKVNRLDLVTNRIEYQVTCSQKVIHYDKLILANGAIGTANILGIELSEFVFDRPMPHWLVNLRLQESCKSDLCYVYGLDSTCDWYRTTNYRAFSGDENDRRLTIEIVGREIEDSEEVIHKLANQLTNLGFIDTSSYDFAATYRLPTGFPSPTQNNTMSLSKLGTRIKATLPSNAILCGIGSAGGLFFQNEVAPDAYQRAIEFTST